MPKRNSSARVEALTFADGLEIDADYFAGASVALLGKRGAGKTYTCRAIAEELHRAQVQTVIIDPMGVFWGLRSNVDGTAGGLPIPVFGGEHGDAPLEPSAGQLMADLAAEERLSMVLDLSQFTSRTQERTFAREFFDRLYRRTRSLVHVIIDEADLFAPQKPRREDAPLLVTMENLVRRGRNKGIGVTMASQRPATINKDVLTQVDALVAMRVTAPQDRDAIRDWVRGQGTDEAWQEIAPSLPSLANGEAWWWVPERGVLKRAQGRRTFTFDSSPTKKRGQAARAPKTFADVDLSAIASQMSATLERAESTDPKLLMRRIRSLEADLAAAVATTNVATPPPPEVAVREVPVLSDDDRELLRAAVAAFRGSAQAFARVHAEMDDHVDAVAKQGEVVQEVATRILQRESVPPTAVPSTPRAPANPQGVAGSKEDPPSDVEVTPARRRLLGALAELAAIGVPSAPKNQLALWAKVSPKSSGFANNLGALRSQGLIHYPEQGRVALTEEGKEWVPAETKAVPASTEGLHQRVKELLTPARWRVLAPLLNVYPRPLSRDVLAQQAEVSAASSGYANNLGALRSLGLIDYPSSGQVTATSILFLQ